MIWGIVSHYNAASSRRISNNFRRFSDRIRKQGLKLIVLEVAYGNAPFSVGANCADKVIQFRSDTVLWHKERLFNLALQHLPRDCDAVCWLDGDVLFENPDWVVETRDALNSYKIIQPFDYCVWLPPGIETIGISDTTYPSVSNEAGRLHSFGFGWKNFGPHALEAGILHGHVGFAWAARRDIIEEIGFYDKAIVGSGDLLIAHAYVGCDTLLQRWDAIYSELFIDDYRRWADKAKQVVNGNVGYIEGTLNHLWHGLSSSRAYLSRLRKIDELGYDPARDLQIGADGLYEWSGNKEELARYVEEYFYSRSEDGASDDLANFIFLDGFYEDEGGFRWGQSYAVLKVIQDVENCTLRIRNDMLNCFDKAQTVRVALNDRIISEALLTDDNVRTIEIGKLRPGDILRFNSDFEFTPSAFGSEDNRNLSFKFLSR
jgi:hypothetical protein